MCALLFLFFIPFEDGIKSDVQKIEVLRIISFPWNTKEREAGSVLGAKPFKTRGLFQTLTQVLLLPLTPQHEQSSLRVQWMLLVYILLIKHTAKQLKHFW